MLRITTRNLQKDSTFEANYNGAVANGVRVGVYKYGYATTVAEAKAEAQSVLDALDGRPLSFPVAYDVESQYLLDMGKTPQEITSQVNAFCQVIAEAGYRPVVYANNEWLTRHMDTSQIPYDIWYARYETSVNE